MNCDKQRTVQYKRLKVTNHTPGFFFSCYAQIKVKQRVATRFSGWYFVTMQKWTFSKGHLCWKYAGLRMRIFDSTGVWLHPSDLWKGQIQAQMKCQVINRIMKIWFWYSAARCCNTVAIYTRWKSRFYASRLRYYNTVSLCILFYFWLNWLILLEIVCLVLKYISSQSRKIS